MSVWNKNANCAERDIAESRRHLADTPETRRRKRSRYAAASITHAPRRRHPHDVRGQLPTILHVSACGLLAPHLSGQHSPSVNFITGARDVPSLRLLDKCFLNRYLSARRRILSWKDNFAAIWGPIPLVVSHRCQPRGVSGADGTR